MIRRFTSGPKPSRTASLVHGVQVLRILCTVTVFYTVETLQVGAGLCSRDRIISGDRIVYQT